LGGVNHCRSHCRLAKFRGVMYGGKCSVVIGRKMWCLYVSRRREKGYWSF